MVLTTAVRDGLGSTTVSLARTPGLVTVSVLSCATVKLSATVVGAWLMAVTVIEALESLVARPSEAL